VPGFGFVFVGFGGWEGVAGRHDDWVAYSFGGSAKGGFWEIYLCRSI
jgi:hypothetical protein